MKAAEIRKLTVETSARQVFDFAPGQPLWRRRRIIERARSGEYTFYLIGRYVVTGGSQRAMLEFERGDLIAALQAVEAYFIRPGKGVAVESIEVKVTRDGTDSRANATVVFAPSTD
jgi:hypothetical protein